MSDWYDICEACELDGCLFDKPIEGVDYSSCAYMKWKEMRREELLKDGILIETIEGLLDGEERFGCE